MHNVTSRCVPATLLLWKTSKFGVCVCSLSYLACTAHVPYCHLLPIWLYNIFHCYLTYIGEGGGESVL